MSNINEKMKINDIIKQIKKDLKKLDRCKFRVVTKKNDNATYASQSSVVTFKYIQYKKNKS